MLIEIKYEYIARATAPRSALDHVRIGATKAVDFAEPSDDDFPMAFVFKEEMQKTPHRYRYDRTTESLFMRWASVKTTVSRNSERDTLDQYYPTKAMHLAARERLEAEYGQRVNFYSQTLWRIDELKDVNLRDVAQAEADLDACLTGFRVMDGFFWKRVSEPVFTVYRVNQGWKTTLTAAESAREGSDRRFFHFGLGQYEEMLDWKARLTQITDRYSTQDEFTSFDVFEPTRDGYAIDLEFVLRDLVSRFSVLSRTVRPNSEAKLLVENVPLAALEVYTKARRILEVPRDMWGERELTEIVTLVEGVPDLVEAHPDYAMLFAKPSENAFHLEKWYGRPISIALGMNGPRLK